MKGYRIFCIVFVAIIIFAYLIGMINSESIGEIIGSLIGFLCSIAVEVYLCLSKPN